MRAVELFAGVGGFRLGLERAGHEVVWANEWDKYAAQTYNKNYGGQIDQRDITTIPATDLPAHDLICGGFPCQAFSVAGKRRGFEETRGTLFFEIMRLARHHRTPYLFLENVKGLLSHDHGRTFETIITTLDESGYDCQWQVLNSKDFGVPQNRERVFIIGHLRGQPRPQVFPIKATDGAYPAELASTTIDANYWKGIDNHGARTAIVTLNPEVHQDYRVYGDTGVAPTLNSSRGGGSAKHPNVLVPYGDSQDQKLNPIDGLSQTLSSGHYKQPKIATGVNRPSRGLEARKDGLAATLKSGQSGTQRPTAIVDARIRRLTPIECERLQGFPDNWTEGVSDTQRYKQMGNAVTVPVIQAVAGALPDPTTTGVNKVPDATSNLDRDGSDG